jgi:hypothetical protein
MATASNGGDPFFWVPELDNTDWRHKVIALSAQKTYF